MASTASISAYVLPPGVPVCQPPHLEGDASLATEILPGPPPLGHTQQPATAKKSSTMYSSLWPDDPGTTYSGIVHGTLIGQESMDILKTRVRVDKSAVTGRAQRASARNNNNSAPTADPPEPVQAQSLPHSPPSAPGADWPMTGIDDDVPVLSRSASSQNLQELPSTSTNGRLKRKDKGKGREIETSAVRVKEEPSMISLLSPEPGHLMTNQDHCSACRQLGKLVYCDGCPRAFHLWCLDPPMESVDEGDSRWFCPACNIRKDPPKKPPASLISPLIHLVDISIPSEFQLPADVRTFFKDVATGDRGAYVDNSELKPPRLNRHGQLEDRDSYRLKDRNGAPVLCHRCGTSALPDNVAAAAPAAKRARRSTSKGAHYEMWKHIVSCDYCDLHWHLDCLDPPLSTMPPFTKKWMCPNHADRILPPRHRIPKHNAPPIEITKPRQFNNGNIEIIPSQLPSTAISHPKVNVDEVLINGRRYRVPERIILLDFWSKVNKTAASGDVEDSSRMSSPLTSLSSLDDLEDRPDPSQLEDIAIAQMLCNFRLGTTGSDPQPSASTSLKRPEIAGKSEPKNVGRPRVIKKIPRNVNGASASASTAKRKKSTSVTADPNARELRSTRTKNGAPSKSSSRLPEDVDPVDPLPDPIAPPKATKTVRVKVEDTDGSLSALSRTNGSTVKNQTTRTRAIRRPPAKDEDVVITEKPRRGRKRQRADEDGDDDGDPTYHGPKGKAVNKSAPPSKSRRKSARTPTHPGPVSAPPQSVMTSSSTTPGTPSLKIRLPRLNTLNPPSAGAHNEDTSTRV
ncbi:hypothetical protein DFS33DRAFT_1293248 [Desarmillaria ectypa]|nr:hypothetical protein DFS33DRAFT_1293248 [Desarmillaria ectypa]